MKIEQRTITTIIAEEGKLLMRTSDGHIFGDRVTLGYDYYDAGVALAEPRLLKPEDFEEIEKPADYEEKPIINQAQRMRRMLALIGEEKTEFKNRSLTAVEMMEVKDLAPVWGKDIVEGTALVKGDKFTFDGKLWSVLQDHTVMAHYEPSVNTAALYTEVTEDYNEEGEENGTRENPIEYNGNMALEEGKYYIQDGVIYLCTRDTINPVYNALKDLVGLYVEVA